MQTQELSKEEEIVTTTEHAITVSELDTLKARANLMSIKYHPAIGVDKLKAKIDAALGSQGVDTVTVGDATFLTHKEFTDLQVKGRKRKAASLVRFRLVCMDPSRKNWEGEIVSVGSAKLGTFKRYIPYVAEDGWHAEHIIYEALKERKCSVFQTVKGARGEKIRKAKMVPAFSIEVLPPLTKAELKDLAQKQAMAGSIDL